MHNSRFRIPLRGVELADGRLVTFSPLTKRPILLSQTQVRELRSRELDAESNDARIDPVAAEWTVDAGEFHERIQAGPARGTPPLSTIAVVTRDRHQSVRRLLGRLCEREGPELERILVLDQSDSPRPLPDRIGNHAPTIQHLTGADVNGLVHRAVNEAGCDERVVAFLFKGRREYPAYGANINVGLILTAGQAVALMDDDIDPRVEYPQGARRGLSYHPAGDPTHLSVFPSDDDAFRALSGCRETVLSSHALMVGLSLAELEKALPLSETVGPQAMSQKLFTASITGRGFVRASAHGIAGDCGLWSLHGYPMRAHSNDSPFWSADLEVYRQARHSRSVIRASGQFCVSPGGFLMNASMAIDNRTVPPPFTPILRNMDGVWSHVVRKCDSDGFLAFLPHTVRHVPENRVGSALDDWESASQVRFCDLLISVVLQLDLPGAELSVTDALSVLGARLRCISQLSDAALREHIEEHVHGILASRLVVVSSALQRCEGRRTGPLVDDLRSQQRAVELRVVGKFQGFNDLAGTDGWPIGLPLVRELLGDMGEMYTAWPRLWRVAREWRSAT